LRLTLLGAACIGLALLRLLIDRPPGGSTGMAWPDMEVARFRLTAAALARAVGASLGVAGLLLQVLLRNPLAEPFTLGLSSGAGLGVMAAMYVAHRMGTGGLMPGAQMLPAIVGGWAVLFIVYALGRRRGGLDPVTLVLIGVVLSATCGAGIMMLQHLVPTGLRGEFTAWLMGNVPEVASTTLLVVTIGAAVAAMVVATWLGSAMDVATLGDDEARSVGLNLGALRAGLFVIAGILGGVTVAVAGPIGFVGLIAPHAARMVLGPGHRPLGLGAGIVGAMILVGADAARQALDLGAGRMPVGVLTALAGGPIFIWLLLSGRARP